MSGYGYLWKEKAGRGFDITKAVRVACTLGRNGFRKCPMTRDMITEYAARVADGTLRADAAQEAALP
ncbi:MAG: hypothetical protein WAP44_12000, partial [Lentibacter algarum]|uniref:hypothetical protein n=1 Tax=Lentibacter algarum TaxID=576131 RepID=UPI003BB1CAB2